MTKAMKIGVLIVLVFLFPSFISAEDVSTANSEGVYQTEVRATLYDNSTGSLEAVGFLDSGTVFRESGRLGSNWHIVETGGAHYYLYSGATKPATANPETVNRSAEKKVMLSQQLPVYSDAKGEKRLGLLDPGTELDVQGQNGDYFVVEFAGVRGYIEGALTSEVRLSHPDYFRVHNRDTPVYRQTSSGLEVAGYIKAGETFRVARDYGANWHEINMGNWRGYVYKGATSSSHPDFMPKPVRSDRTLGTLTVERRAPIFDNSTGSLHEFASVERGRSLTILRDYGANWYEVSLGGRIGYINKARVSRTFAANDRFFTTGANGAVIYDNRSGQLEAVGRLLPHQTYHRTRDYGRNWHEIQFGSMKGYIYKGGTFPTTQQYPIVSGGRPLVEVRADKRMTVYDSSRGGRTSIGTVERGTVFNVTAKTGQWYEINFASKRGYIYAPAVTPTIGKVIQPRQNYSYQTMTRDLEVLEAMYPNLISVVSSGKSVQGRDIPVVKLGNGDKKVMFNGSFHAREHMTTNVMMNMIDEYARAYSQNRTLGRYSPSEILDDVSIWFVPMVNPDGVTLVQRGSSGMRESSSLIQWNNGSRNFTSWKANIRGVDLNRQFPTYWSTISNNPGRPAPQNYKGRQPLTEPEAIFMYNLMNKHNFLAVMSYHSSGEVLFARSRLNGGMSEMSHLMRNVTGYPILDLTSSRSGGGYSDWIAVSKGVPAITVEIAPFTGAMPVPLHQWDRVWQRNQHAGLAVANHVR